MSTQTSLIEQFASEFFANPTRRRIAEQGARCLRSHLIEYRQFLLAKGSGKRHVRDSVRRSRVLSRLCRARFASDVTPAGVTLALARLRSQRPRRKTIGPATANHYLQSFKSFFRWMVIDARAEFSPTDSVRPFNVQTDVRRRRRSLSRDEVLRLIDAANRGETVDGLSGTERAMMYTVACTTGLRCGEIVSLTAASFVLDGADPHVIVEAAYSKHRRRDVIPLRADVATLLRAYVGPLLARGRVFRRPRCEHMARALRVDLAAAGIAYCVDGQYADFHALRHTFVSSLFDAGCTPKEAQTLARHQDARLTLGRYAHVSTQAQRAAVERLPSLMSPLDERTQQHGNASHSTDPLSAAGGDVAARRLAKLGATGNRTPIC